MANFSIQIIEYSSLRFDKLNFGYLKFDAIENFIIYTVLIECNNGAGMLPVVYYYSLDQLI